MIRRRIRSRAKQVDFRDPAWREFLDRKHVHSLQADLLNLIGFCPVGEELVELLLSASKHWGLPVPYFRSRFDRATELRLWPEKASPEMVDWNPPYEFYDPVAEKDGSQPQPHRMRPRPKE